MPCLFVSSPNNLKLQEETVCKIRNKSCAIENGPLTLLEKLYPFRKQKASLIIVIVIIVIVIISFFSGWNIWQLDGGELCQEPGPLAGGGDDDVEESAEDEDVDGDEDSDVDDVDDEGVDDNVLVEGEHNQLAPCQHLLLQPTHRIPGQGGHHVLLSFVGQFYQVSLVIVIVFQGESRYHQLIPANLCDLCQLCSFNWRVASKILMMMLLTPYWRGCSKGCLEYFQKIIHICEKVP